MAAEPVVSLRDVYFSYGSLPVLESVNFEIGQRESVCIVGPNGGGKTTLAKLILGLLEPDAGETQRPEVEEHGDDVRHEGEEAHAEGREEPHEDRVDEEEGDGEGLDLPRGDVVHGLHQQDRVARRVGAELVRELLEALLEPLHQPRGPDRVHRVRAHVDVRGLEAAVDVAVELVAGPEERTVQLRDALESRGIFGSVFCAPATPRNHSLVRLCLNTSVTTAEIERVIAVCREIRGVVRPDRWPTLVKRRSSSNVEYLAAATA